MRGKTVKRLRSLAKSKSHSENETTYQGAHQVKLEWAPSPVKRGSNIVEHKGDYIFVQRLLHPFSVKAILKKVKKFQRVTPRPLRHVVAHQLSLILSTEPELLGLGQPAQ